MNEELLLKWGYVGATAVWAACSIIVAADMHGAGGWLWKRAPGLLKRTPPKVHRAIMATTLLMFGLVTGVWSVVAALGDFNPNAMQAAGHGLAALISFGVACCRPLQAALETTHTG